MGPADIERESDGASRRSDDGSFVGGCGVVRCLASTMMGKIAIFLGDVTNNIAEYNGILYALRYACRNSCQRFCFQVDSILVARQLNGVWACKSESLRPLYEEALHLLSSLRADPLVEVVLVEHIYREFHADVDALANLGIDAYRHGEHSDGRVLWENWY